MGNTNLTQCEKIMSYLNQYGSITQYDALADLGIMRLASRISEMKKRGVSIITTKKAVKNRNRKTCFVAVYSLNKRVLAETGSILSNEEEYDDDRDLPWWQR